MMYTLVVCAAALLVVGGVQAPAANDLVELLSDETVRLDRPADLDVLLQDVGERRLALLGEASHGTHEFYTWRTEISKRLIVEKGFSFIAVEGDWASLYRLNDYVKDRPGAASSAREVLEGFDRWPPWMWGNTAVEELAEWLREHNSGLPETEKIGFFGMDVYGHWDAMDDLLAFVEERLPEHSEAISEKLDCFAAYDRDEQRYARAVALGAPSCEEALAELVALLREARDDFDETERKAYFRAKQNALVIQNAETHLRLSARDRAGSWNSRARHMWTTAQRLLEVHGDGAKGIVWAHNTHVGDARATPMARQGQVNIGQLSRQDLGEDRVFIAGFGTYGGEVNAGRQWGGPMEIMTVPDAMPGSIEHVFRQLEAEAFYLSLASEALRDSALGEIWGHRAIGVIYRPENERGNYVPTLLPSRYDGFLFIRETQALTPVR